MQLQPRHEKVIAFLTSRYPKRFGLDEIAKTLKISMPVLRNEAPKLVDQGFISRRSVGRTFEYWVKPIAEEPTKPVVVKALGRGDVEILLNAILNPEYTPALTKLDWTMPAVVACTVNGISTVEARKALERFLAAIETTQGTCRSLLATRQLWDGSALAWLTEGLTEKNLERIEELARQALELHGRLTPSETT